MRFVTAIFISLTLSLSLSTRVLAVGGASTGGDQAYPQGPDHDYLSRAVQVQVYGKQQGPDADFNAKVLATLASVLVPTASTSLATIGLLGPVAKYQVLGRGLDGGESFCLELARTTGAAEVAALHSLFDQLRTLAPENTAYLVDYSTTCPSMPRGAPGTTYLSVSESALLAAALGAVDGTETPRLPAGITQLKAKSIRCSATTGPAPAAQCTLVLPSSTVQVDGEAARRLRDVLDRNGADATPGGSVALLTTATDVGCIAIADMGNAPHCHFDMPDNR